MKTSGSKKAKRSTTRVPTAHFHVMDFVFCNTCGAWNPNTSKKQSCAV